MSEYINKVIDFNQEYIVIDLEADGLLNNPKLLQIGAIKVLNNQIIDKLEIDVKYDQPLSSFLQLLLKNFISFKREVFLIWEKVM